MKPFDRTDRNRPLDPWDLPDGKHPKTDYAMRNIDEHTTQPASNDAATQPHVHALPSSSNVHEAEKEARVIHALKEKIAAAKAEMARLETIKSLRDANRKRGNIDRWEKQLYALEHPEKAAVKQIASLTKRIGQAQHRFDTLIEQCKSDPQDIKAKQAAADELRTLNALRRTLATMVPNAATRADESSAKQTPLHARLKTAEEKPSRIAIRYEHARTKASDARKRADQAALNANSDAQLAPLARTLEDVAKELEKVAVDRQKALERENERTASAVARRQKRAEETVNRTAKLPVAKSERRIRRPLNPMHAEEQGIVELAACIAPDAPEAKHDRWMKDATKPSRLKKVLRVSLAADHPPRRNVTQNATEDDAIATKPSLVAEQSAAPVMAPYVAPSIIEPPRTPRSWAAEGIKQRAWTEQQGKDHAWFERVREEAKYDAASEKRQR